MAYKIKNKSRHFFFLLAIIAGIWLVARGAYLHRLTFIPWYAVLGIVLGITAAATTLSYHSFRRTYEIPSKVLLPLVFTGNILSWGFIGISLFLMSNYYLAKGPVIRKEFAILARLEQPGENGEPDKARPIFTIAYRGQEKNVYFAHRVYKWKDEYQSVILGLQQGCWGYEVIKSKAVTK